MKKVLSLILMLALLLNVSAFSVGAETATGDVFDVISDGIATSEKLLQGELSKLHNDGGVGYGFEWYIIALLRAGKDIDENILNEYYQSVCEKVTTWTDETKPTDIERTALALAVMKKGITDVAGKDLAALIFNSQKLADGPNELAYALLALDASGITAPDDAVWSKAKIISELLGFQNADGSFAVVKDGVGDADITAMCLQALAPYREETGVAQAIDGGVGFLKGKLSDKFTISDNANSTAQVLLSLATLDIDVTDPENGFGDSDKNIVAALKEFKNPNGSGYVYGENVSAMTTVQVMQAYDAYRKAFKEDVSYWEFKTEGAKYNDTTSDEESGDEVSSKAEKAVVYVTVATDGDIVMGKDGKSVSQVPVTVSDKNEDGRLTVDEALYATHKAYYNGGAESGYASAETAYGLSIITLWGRGDFENPTSAGYWKNNASCWSLEDEVKEGDFVVAFNYYDATGWSDAYSYFTNSEVSIEAGERAVLELKYSGYDEVWNPVSFACAGARIKFVNCENAPSGEFVTDAEGKVSIAFSEDAQAGEYFAVAYKDDKSIVPSVCKITVTSASQGGDSETPEEDSTGKITVYIKVYDPKGQTYLPKKTFSVEKGTSAYEFLCKTGLRIETENTAYGIYIKSIEGLGEFDAGKKSGWMYSVNGEFPDYSLDSYTLASGDFVEVIYTRAYGEDIGGPALRAEETPEEESEQEKKPATESIKGFADVGESDWYYDAVNFVSESNLMKGTDKGFEPQGKMTRAMLVTVIWRLENEPKTEKTHKFDDVKSGEWYSDALSWAYSEKIVSGISDKLFGPNSDITREQLVTILYRYAQKKGGNSIKSKSSIASYTDANKVSAYAKDAMSWAISAGIINGATKETLAPRNTATRAEVATMFMRFCKMLKNETYDGASQPDIVGQTANYLTENIKEPQVSSIGGEWGIIGLARSGQAVPDGYFDLYYSNVEDFVRLKEGVLHSRKYTEYSRVIIALSAIGRDAENVAGYNLVAPLFDYEKTVWQGINGAAWALIALDSGNYGASEIREEYILHILKREKKDGGWSLSDDEKNPDADITAMMLIALSNYREREDVNAAIERGIRVLSELQDDDGGYISEGKKNSETAAQVLTAISTLGISYEDLRFVKNGKSLLDNILSFKLPDGSFMHTDKSNVMATEQCFYALVAAERLEKQKSPLFDMSDI